MQSVGSVRVGEELPGARKGDEAGWAVIGWGDDETWEPSAL